MNSADIREKILSRLRMIKHEYPHLRFGQILCSAAMKGTDSSSLFYAEDGEFLQRLEMFYDTLKSQEKKMQIEEVQQKKAELERSIRDQVIEFENQTSCKITEIYLQRHPSYFTGHDCISVQAGVSL